MTCLPCCRATTVLILGLAVAWAGQATGDDLFSSVPIDSVFTGSTGASDPASNSKFKANEPAQRVQKVLNLDQLADLLRDAGLEPAANDSAVAVNIEHARWKFTAVLSLQEDLERIVILLGLTDIDEKPGLSAERLLGLLAANRERQPASFVYSEQTKRVELLLRLANDQVSPRLLGDEIRRLAEIAESTASLWEIGSTPAAKSAPAGNQSAVSPNLVGKWSATRSEKEAFAMQLSADGSFVLVYVKEGKQSRSTGKFAVSGEQLILTSSDGEKFTGNLSNVTAAAFDFAPASAARLTFRKAS